MSLALACCAVLLRLAVLAAQQDFRYVKPWDPFRRSVGECEMCNENRCMVTPARRCEYYAEASRLTHDDGDDADDSGELEARHGDKIDDMLFELVDSASLEPQFAACIPLVSQYTDCTEENICTGCKFCSCNEEGRWICSDKHKCRPVPKLSIDHRVVGIVIENLKRKEKTQERRVKRSASTANTKNVKEKLTYRDISKWMYGVEPLNYEQKSINIGDILAYLETKTNGTIYGENRNINQAAFTQTESVFTTDSSTNKGDNYVDLLEFNDILQIRSSHELSTTKPFIRFEEIPTNDVDYSEYDPIRLIKRDTSLQTTNENSTILQINTTSSNITYEIILNDAVQGLNRITSEKQKELDELMNIQNNLLNIAKAHNIVIDVNSTKTRDSYNKHHIAIYKLDTIDKCVAKVKQELCSAIEDVSKTKTVSNSSDPTRDLNLIFKTASKYVLQEDRKIVNTETNIVSSQEHDQDPRRHIKVDSEYQKFNYIMHVGNILEEINKAPGNPLRSLSQQARKILKRVVKQLYLDDFAVIDFIVHETYYDFDSYLQNIGSKWNKMMQDVINSDVFDSLYSIKLLHMTLKADINKMEDMITLLDFARNRRMTVANGVTIDKSILRIQNNLKLIDNTVQKIMKFEKNKRLRQGSNVENKKPAKKKSILQKLKKMFQNSKNDIKEMLRKRFPKSEIMKRIAKKKIDELEQRRMLDYQETMKQWEENLNSYPMREKRSAWGFQAFADRIKSIIPGYLRRKVKPGLKKKKNKNRNKTQTTRTHGRKKKRNSRSTTIKTTTVSRRSNETKQGVSGASV